MKTIISALLALTFILPSAPSHAFNPQGSRTVTQRTGQLGVTGYSLVAQCPLRSQKGGLCWEEHMRKNIKTKDPEGCVRLFREKRFSKTEDDQLLREAWQNCLRAMGHNERSASILLRKKIVYDSCMRDC
jgi:hypothetical protein